MNAKKSTLVAHKNKAAKTNKKKGSLVKIVVLEDKGKWIKPEKGSTHYIDEDAQFPDITFEIETEQAGPYEWKWQIKWDAKVSGLKESASRGKLLKTFEEKNEIQNDGKSWKVNLNNKTVGGVLTVEVKAGEELFKRNIYIKGKNPTISKVKDYLKNIPDTTGFDKLLEKESKGKHFINADNEPIVAFDKGYGITQITNPHPNFEQIWNWKENIKIGSDLYKHYQKDAKKMLDKHPPYTDEMLANETYGRWNGGGYYRWSAEQKQWIKNDNVLCDSETGNMGWNTSIEKNKDKTEKELHERDKSMYKKGKVGQTLEHPWKYSGICYADHVNE